LRSFFALEEKAIWYRRWWSTNFRRLIIPKKDVEFEKETAHVRVITTEILALPGARTKALLLFAKVSDAHDSTLLLLLVSHTCTHKRTRARVARCVCSRGRVSSRKCEVATANALFAVNSTFSSRQGRSSGYFQHFGECKFASETVRRRD